MSITDIIKEGDEAVYRLLHSPLAKDGEVACYTGEQLFSIGSPQLERVQLAILKKRFSDLSPKLPALRKLAEDNDITAINAIDDLVPLLFPHTVYKSYPMSLIDNCRFEQLNAWLNDLTTHDLSGLDVSGCESLDDWLDVIETDTPVRVLTSSGTSGKISIVPKDKLEICHTNSGFSAALSKFDDEPGFANPFAPTVYHVCPFARHSRHSTGVMVKTMIEDAFHGDERHVLTLEGTMSTDLLWMTGRIKKAKADGNLEQLKKTKAWKRLSSHIAELEARKAESLDEFFKNVVIQLKNKTVVMMMGINYYSALVECAEKYGLEIRFAPDSYFTVGGGQKWDTLSDAQKEKIWKVLPHQFGKSYGFAEILTAGPARLCSAGNYHSSPWVVNFVLNPDTGAPYPRKGTQTGRYAAFDLWAHTYWGGFISGDEVTICWDKDCDCGRKGPYMHPEIIRYSEKHGGDDKITCQRTAAAVEEMLEHMNAKDI